MSTTTVQRASFVGAMPEASSVQTLFGWFAVHPMVTCVSLTLAYLATLAGVVAVLMASAMATPVGIGMFVLFGAEVLVYVAIATYTMFPERPKRG